MTKKSVSSKSSFSEKKVSSEEKINKILIENLVSLQKVLTNLSLKFDSLTKRLDGMIDLFEESAKTVVKGEIRYMEDSKHTEKVLGKMDKLFEQNKLIARGLTLLNESTSSLGGSSSEPIAIANAEGPKGFDASPEVNNRGSPYAMPYSEISSQERKKGSSGMSSNFNRKPSGFNPSSFSPSAKEEIPQPQKPKPMKEGAQGNQGKHIPSSPPFNNF